MRICQLWRWSDITIYAARMSSMIFLRRSPVREWSLSVYGYCYKFRGLHATMNILIHLLIDKREQAINGCLFQFLTTSTCHIFWRYYLLASVNSIEILPQTPFVWFDRVTPLTRRGFFCLVAKKQCINQRRRFDLYAANLTVDASCLCGEEDDESQRDRTDSNESRKNKNIRCFLCDSSKQDKNWYGVKPAIKPSFSTTDVISNEESFPWPKMIQLYRWSSKGNTWLTKTTTLSMCRDVKEVAETQNDRDSCCHSPFSEGLRFCSSSLVGSIFN